MSVTKKYNIMGNMNTFVPDFLTYSEPEEQEDDDVVKLSFPRLSLFRQIILLAT